MKDDKLLEDIENILIELITKVRKNEDNGATVLVYSTWLFERFKDELKERK